MSIKYKAISALFLLACAFSIARFDDSWRLWLLVPIMIFFGYIFADYYDLKERHG